MTRHETCPVAVRHEKATLALSATGQHARITAILLIAFTFAALTVAALYGTSRQDHWCASHQDQARTASACAYYPNRGHK